MSVISFIWSYLMDCIHSCSVNLHDPVMSLVRRTHYKSPLQAGSQPAVWYVDPLPELAGMSDVYSHNSYISPQESIRRGGMRCKTCKEVFGCI